jgi:hypothetical protein
MARAGDDNITVACYYFGNYHPNDSRNRKPKGEGWSEWELVKQAKPRFEGHHQPKVPLWGYTDESDPKEMERKIDEAFLQARNNSRVKFALMWANHDWKDIHPYTRDGPKKVLYPGKVAPETFDKVCDLGKHDDRLHLRQRRSPPPLRLPRGGRRQGHQHGPAQGRKGVPPRGRHSRTSDREVSAARQARCHLQRADDLGETKNLAAEKTGRTADLKQKLAAWRQRVIARMPIPNPHYNESRSGEWWSMHTGKPIDSDSRKRFPPTEKDL